MDFSKSLNENVRDGMKLYLNKIKCFIYSAEFNILHICSAEYQGSVALLKTEFNAEVCDSRK